MIHYGKKLSPLLSRKSQNSFSNPLNSSPSQITITMFSINKLGATHSPTPYVSILRRYPNEILMGSKGDRQLHPALSQRLWLPQAYDCCRQSFLSNLSLDPRCDCTPELHRRLEPIHIRNDCVIWINLTEPEVEPGSFSAGHTPPNAPSAAVAKASCQI